MGAINFNEAIINDELRLLKIKINYGINATIVHFYDLITIFLVILFISKQ